MLNDPSINYDKLPLAPIETKIQIADLIGRVAYYNDRGKYELLSACLASEIEVDAIALLEVRLKLSLVKNRSDAISHAYLAAISISIW